MIVAVSLLIIFLPMLGETALSARHDRALRASGAIEPRGDVIAMMQLAYPGSFAAMLAEGWWRGVRAMTTDAAAGAIDLDDGERDWWRVEADSGRLAALSALQVFRLR